MRFKSVIIFLSLIFISFCIKKQVHAQSVSDELIDSIRAACVYIELEHELLPSGEKGSSSGSGFFISPNGYLVTNYHVVRSVVSLYKVNFPAPVISIRVYKNSGTSDYQVYDAKILAVDKENDLALLSVNDTVAFPYLELDHSDKPSSASAVLAFGFPFGDAFGIIQRGPEITISRGFITALRHNDQDQLSLIQFDARVNSGNSGGPLVNEKGKVIGVVTLGGGSTGINFAVPVHYLKTLLESISTDVAVQDSVKINISTDIHQASVFIDGQFAGLTPLKDVTLETGWKTILVSKHGYVTSIKQETILTDKTIEISLNPQVVITLPGNQLVPDAKVLSKISKTESGWLSLLENSKSNNTNILLEENFSNKETFETWEQSTGGVSRRTWFIKNNAIHQHEIDGALHAIYLGETSLSDYLLQVRMKITETPSDGRAGIIFHENEEGFYLFRIHKETNKAQLAYHRKNPFGWFVLLEQNFEEDIENDWNTLTVYTSGQLAACFFEEKLVFLSTTDFASAGRVGLYSVDSKASFDNLKVYQSPEYSDELSNETQTGFLSFWFSDYFSPSSNSWYQYKNNHEQPFSWQISDAGMGISEKDSNRYVSEFMPYHLTNFQMSVLISLDSGNDDAYMEIFFRKHSEQSYFAIRFSRKGNIAQLIRVSDSSVKTIKQVTLPGKIFNNTFALYVEVNNNSVVCRTSRFAIFDVKDKDIPVSEGTFGFAASNVKMVLHEINVAMVSSEEEEKGKTKDKGGKTKE